MANRVTWIDSARGLAIVAVVLFHSALHLRDTNVAGPWPSLVLMLETFRMPTFFFISGLVSANVLTRPTATTWRR
ncbi:acyltransferase family protein, partial [Bacillus sp. SIMBA_008]